MYLGPNSYLKLLPVEIFDIMRHHLPIITRYMQTLIDDISDNPRYIHYDVYPTSKHTKLINAVIQLHVVNIKNSNKRV